MGIEWLNSAANFWVLHNGESFLWWNFRSVVVGGEKRRQPFAFGAMRSGALRRAFVFVVFDAELREVRWSR